MAKETGPRPTLLGAARQIVGAAAPDRRRALERYGAMAASYDHRTLGGQYFRRLTVTRLAPLPGEVILDVGCGTGLNFAPILARIGPAGRLIGIELSPKMLDRARARVRKEGWTNIELVQADIAEVEVSGMAHGALMCGVHDVMRSPPALENVLRHLHPGARIVAGGPKWAPWWTRGAFSMNLSTWRMNRDCVTTFEGFMRPWSRLQLLVDNLVVDEVFNGGGYLAHGIRPPTLWEPPGS
jgi:ubiquinone/menaquinone biosynthesis C-methylase UbiE